MADQQGKRHSRKKGLPRHPTERGEGRGRFDTVAESVSNLASSGLFFSICFLIIGVWVVGLIFGFANGTENALTGAMTGLTLLLVALLKNSELRAERAMQLKLDAIAAAMLRDSSSGLDTAARSDLEDAVRLHEEL
jgi:low affinity Fe/Cu permease